MAFDLTPLSKNLSNVQASAKTTDGGAGNTGYFSQENNEENEFHFKRDYEPDSFMKSQKVELLQEDDVSISRIILDFIEKIIDKISNFIEKLFLK